MPGFVDLHCHYLPAVDDGVRSHEEGVELCRRLAGIGYATVTATPHIRSAMFDNKKPDLVARFERFREATRDEDGLPELLLGAEHFCDDVFWKLFEQGQLLPYTGEKALLVELPPNQLPIGLEERVFRLQVRGLRPVIAHPERYAPLFSVSAPLERVLELGALALLDLMSLVGRYGRRPRNAAERMLEEGRYYAACSDCHRPDDVADVEAAIARLRKLVGEEEAEAMLSDHPRAILDGEVER